MHIRSTQPSSVHLRFSEIAIPTSSHLPRRFLATISVALSLPAARERSAYLNQRFVHHSFILPNPSVNTAGVDVFKQASGIRTAKETVAWLGNPPLPLLQLLPGVTASCVASNPVPTPIHPSRRHQYMHPSDCSRHYNLPTALLPSDVDRTD